MDAIFIHELRLEASVGIYPRERAARQLIELNLEIGMPEAATQHDDIAFTIDYAEVVRRIENEFAVRHFNLLETLAEYVSGLLTGDFRAPWARVTVAKIGMLRGVRRVGVTIERGGRSEG
ncbi:MAG: dihydroneopterin aldolase [Betaproteobacteria bacterium]|nr:dihydroneopterin aldolase [Betaproteobacteria bacterium]